LIAVDLIFWVSPEVGSEGLVKEVTTHLIVKVATVNEEAVLPVAVGVYVAAIVMTDPARFTSVGAMDIV